MYTSDRGPHETAHGIHSSGNGHAARGYTDHGQNVASPWEPGGSRPSTFATGASRQTPASRSRRVRSSRCQPFREPRSFSAEGSEELSLRRGETVGPSGASAANALGLTTQVPTRTVYLTSGRSRKITLDKQIVHLQHAPSWQLTLAKEPAGEIVRALAWAGPERVNRALKEIEAKVPRSEFRRITQQSSLLPLWMATALSQAVHYA